MLRARLIAVTCCMAVVMEAAAHDFWIQPETFEPAVGKTLKVGLRVGDGFPGEAVNRDPLRIVKFVDVGPGGEADILGVAGRDPAGVLKPTAAGLHLLGYRSNHAFVELEAEKFESYLKEKGLDQIVATRKERGESEKPGREAYSRCAKAVIHVTDQAAKSAESKAAIRHDQPLGLTLELIPATDPATLKPGDELAVQLLFDSKPLSGALVQAATPADVKSQASGRTDSDGRVKLKLGCAGMWRIAAVHMTAAPTGVDLGHAADWESFWATLTLEVRSPGEP